MLQAQLEGLFADLVSYFNRKFDLTHYPGPFTYDQTKGPLRDYLDQFRQGGLLDYQRFIQHVALLSKKYERLDCIDTSNISTAYLVGKKNTRRDAQNLYFGKLRIIDYTQEAYHTVSLVWLGYVAPFEVKQELTLIQLKEKMRGVEHAYIVDLTQSCKQNNALKIQGVYPFDSIAEVKIMQRLNMVSPSKDAVFIYTDCTREVASFNLSKWSRETICTIL